MHCPLNMRVNGMAQVTLELLDGSRRSVPARNLHEVSDERWKHLHAAPLAQKRSALQLATRQAYSREQEQVEHTAQRTQSHAFSAVPHSEDFPIILKPVAKLFASFGGPAPQSGVFVFNQHRACACFCSDLCRPRASQARRKTRSVAGHCTSRMRAAHGWSALL